MNRLKLAWKAIRTMESWPLFFLGYLRLVKPSYAVFRMRDGARLGVKAASEEQTAFSYIWLKDSYTPAGFEIRNSDIVFDVGAHLGLFTVLAARSAERVIAFEPSHENAEATEKNVSLNNLHNVVIEEVGLAGISGTARLYLAAGTSAGHSFFFPHEGTDATISVPTITLEEYMKMHKINRVDFLKLNCEGAEYDILFGCPDAILKNIRVISMQCHEWDEKWNSAAMRRFLESKGFTVTARSEGNMLYAKRTV